MEVISVFNKFSVIAFFATLVELPEPISMYFFGLNLEISP
jgi:hypothetical protein